MRGKASSLMCISSALRITPAYAGKSSLYVSVINHTWDHPRVCGEKIRAYVKIWNEWGSPPRMRGKVAVKVVF